MPTLCFPSSRLSLFFRTNGCLCGSGGGGLGYYSFIQLTADSDGVRQELDM